MPRLISRRVASTVALLAMGAGLLAACALPNNQPGPNATTGAPATTGPSFPTTVEDYAKAAVKAWVDKDSAWLDQLEANGGVLHQMAACAGCYDVNFTLINCDGTAGSSYCLFFNNVGDELTLQISHQLLGQPLAVIAGSKFDPITFPSDNKAYAQLALNAWLNRNDARLKLLTANNMTSAQVDALGANRNVLWTFDHSEGAMGSLYYEWHDPAGHGLAFRFVNGPPAPTTGPGSHHRIADVIYMP